MLSIGYFYQISGPKTLHLKSIKNKQFIIINISIIFIILQIIRVHIYPFRTLRRHLYALSVSVQVPR
jgi:hypothetical protein